MLELVFGIGLVLVNRCFVTFCHSEASEINSSTKYMETGIKYVKE